MFNRLCAMYNKNRKIVLLSGRKKKKSKKKEIGTWNTKRLVDQSYADVVTVKIEKE